MKLLRLLALLALSPLVIAAGTTASLTWTLPITYTDGSVLPITDLASTTISWTGGPAGTVTIAAPATSTTVNVPCGSVTFTATVTTTSTAKYPNATSSPTGPVPYATGVTCAPNPPGALTVK